MKKIYSMMMMLAMMVAAMSFTACSSDDDNDPGTGSGDFFQVVIDGKTYTNNILPDAYAGEGTFRDHDNKPLTWTYDGGGHFNNFEEGMDFGIGVIHYAKKADLLASSLGTYGCVEGPLYSNTDNNFKNLNFWSSLTIDFNDYELKGGTHEVTSIKDIAGKVQIEGKFTTYHEYRGDKQTVTGNYRITIR